MRQTQAQKKVLSFEGDTEATFYSITSFEFLSITPWLKSEFSHTIPSETINLNQTANGRSIYHPQITWKQERALLGKFETLLK